LHLFDITQEIICDLRNGNIIDIQFISFNKEEQQVKGTFELRQGYLIGVFQFFYSGGQK